MNIITGLLLILVLVILHVIMRRIRKLDEMILADNDKMKNSLVKIGEWMIHFDIGLGRLFEKTGLMEEGASIDEALKAFVKDAEAKSWMTMPQEAFEETMERLSKEGSGFDEIDEAIELTDEIVEPLPFTIPNLEFGGDWRETDEYVTMRNGQEGC